MGRITRHAALVVLALAASAAVAAAQRGFRGYAPELVIKTVPYDGRFTFARLKYTTGPGGLYYGGLPAWSHGYMKAENNLTRIVSAISKVRINLDASNVLAMDDPELMKYPVTFMTEAGYWQMNDKEAAGLRAYLLKGGFIIFDDFRDDRRDNYQGWSNFTTQIKRVIPNVIFYDIPITHPIFHSFFEINSFSIIPQSYGNGRPIFRAIYENNDPKKRLLAIINFNTDVSDFWEFSNEGRYLVSDDNEAYKLGVNYLVYGLTH
jgi:hypothetical protein